MENKNKHNKFAYKTQGTQSTSELRRQLQEILRELINQEFINKETGLKASISQREINKMSEQKAINKSLDNGFSKEEHFEVAKDIAPLYENATLKEKHADYKIKEQSNIANVYRFNIDISVNDKETTAKITAFEKIEGKNKIYTIELLGLDPLPYSSRVQEAEVAKSLNYDATTHNEASPIADFDNKSVSQNKPKSQGIKPKSNDFEREM